MKLETELGGLRLRNPLIMASGTYGYGWEFQDFVDYSKLGGMVAKTVTVKARKGNKPPRTCETASGVLNSIGLPNGGIEQFLRVGLGYLEKLDTCRIASIAGETSDEFAELAGRISERGGADALEVNVSCPNVERGGLSFGVDAKATAEVTKAVRKATQLPVIVKLTPNVTSIGEIAKAAEGAGADAISAVNTFVGTAVDWRRGRLKLGRGTGGLSGPAIKPLALRAVMEVGKSVKIPVIGIGGITTGGDVLEFLSVGASAVEVGTANLVEPAAAIRILGEMERLADECGFTSIEELRGRLEGG